MKSKFLKICLSLAIVGTLISSTSYITKAAGVYNSTAINANLNATAVPDHIALSWTSDPTTTETITWRTISTNTKGNVQYRIKGTSTWTTTADVTPKILTSGTGDATVTTGTENIYSTTLTGLTPGTTYEYQVIGTDAANAANSSAINTFTTESSNNTSTKFLLFGDSQSGIAADPEYTPWHNTIQEAYSQNKDANFVVNLGDLVEIGQNYQHWNNWFSAAEGVINNIPEMPVQGNHETYQSNTYNSSYPQDFTNQFSVPQNGPYGHIGQTYSYNYGNVHFVVLDSQEDEEAPGNDSFLQQQAAWLENDLTNNTQKWTIVMFHKTPYYNKKTRNNPAVKDILTPVIERHHVDIVFNGHDHGLSRTYAINGDNYYTDYSKGTVYYVTGRSGNKCYTDLNNKVWDAFFSDTQDSPTYEVVSVVNGKLTIDAYKYNTFAPNAANPKMNVTDYTTPTKIDTLTIDKDNPANSTKLTVPTSENTGLTIAGTLQSGYNVTVSNNKGYIDPSLIATYYKGSYDTTSLKLTVSGKSYQFAQSDLLNGDPSKVNIDALYKQGIDVKYNSALNDVLVDFTGRITPDMIAAFKGFVIGNVPTDTGSNGQGSNGQGTNGQGANSQGTNSQGANSQGTNSQGANNQGANNQNTNTPAVQTTSLTSLPKTGQFLDTTIMIVIGLLLIIAGGSTIFMNKMKIKL